MKPVKGKLTLKKVSKPIIQPEQQKRQQLESFLTKRLPSKKHGLTCQRDFEERHQQQVDDNETSKGLTKKLKEVP